MAIAPPQARNPKNFYLGKLGPSHLSKMRQDPEKEPSMIPIIMASLVFLTRLPIYERLRQLHIP